MKYKIFCRTLVTLTALLLISFTESTAQSTVPLRGDTIRVYKQGDTAVAKIDSILFVTMQQVIGRNYSSLNASISLDLRDTIRAFKTNDPYSRLRIVTPEDGMIIYEDSTEQFLGYVDGAWSPFGGGSASTLQEVFDTEVGGSVLTKMDTINVGSSALQWLRILGSGSTLVLQVINTGSGKAINGGASTGTAIEGNSVDGLGLRGTSVTNAAGEFSTGASTGNDIVRVAHFYAQSQSTIGSNGIGGELLFGAESSTTVFPNAAKFQWYYPDATHATRTTYLNWLAYDGGSEENFMQVQPEWILVRNLTDTLATLEDVRAGGGGVSEPSTQIVVGTGGGVDSYAGFTYDGDVVTITENSLGESVADTKGLRLANTTAAVDGTNQFSPSLIFEGYGWDDNDDVSTKQEMKITLETFKSATANDSAYPYLSFMGSINNQSYTSSVRIYGNGTMSIGNNENHSTLLGTNMPGIDGLFIKTNNQSSFRYGLSVGHSGGSVFLVQNNGMVSVQSYASFAVGQYGSTEIQSATFTVNGGSTGMTMIEQTTPATPSANYARVYPKSDGLWYGIDDAGTETMLSNTAGGGDVFKVGTPVNNQIGVWTGDGTIEGEANITWNGSELFITGSLQTTGTILGNALQTNEISTPGTPSSGRGFFYFKSDNLPYAKNDAGTEMALYNAGGGGITIGTTTITGGTNTRVLYNNSGVAGEYTISGTGNVAMTTSATLTTPIFADGGFISDVNGNELLIFDNVASAVNEFTISNAATGGMPILSATGEINVNMGFQSKGTGDYLFFATADGATEIKWYEDTDNGSNFITVIGQSSLGGNVTVTLPNASSTLPIFSQQATFSGMTAARTYTLPDANVTLLPNTSTAGVAASPTSSTTETITHSLGRIPTIIRVYSIGGFVANAAALPTSQSMGIFNSSGNRCVFQRYDATTITAAEPSETSTTFAIFIGTGNGNFISGVIQNVTSTQFDIVWTETGTAAAQNYMWEAQ